MRQPSTDQPMHLPGCNEGCDPKRGIHTLGIAEAIVGPVVQPMLETAKVKVVTASEWDAFIADPENYEGDVDETQAIAAYQAHTDLVARGIDPEAAIDLLDTARHTAETINARQENSQ